SPPRAIGKRFPRRRATPFLANSSVSFPKPVLYLLCEVLADVGPGVGDLFVAREVIWTQPLRDRGLVGRPRFDALPPLGDAGFLVLHGREPQHLEPNHVGDRRDVGERKI